MALPRQCKTIEMQTMKSHSAPLLILGLLAVLVAISPTSAIETVLTIEPSPSQPRNSEGDIVVLKDRRLCLIYSRFRGGGSDHAEADLAMRVSADRGNTWNGNLLCVWNDHSGQHPFPAGKRTPLCMAISRDEGETWESSRVIEDAPDGWYCYTSITFQQERMLLSYCAGDSHVGGLNRLKVLAIEKADLE